ncbi:origin recognition complex subunit 3 [Pararge aegeria]|uniref:origin recognition complex subunit 3 n=1 Tax=Pararge aegeria TaxID=116150 RepID=UPI0019D19DBC|nr:origin recognition complex subunit 3 [Pararge aegeria]XP_039749029.1 origin recognition complex subunit 3 [Pararge aegeria]
MKSKYQDNNMESTVSVSKGVFLFSNGFKRAKHLKKKSKQPLFDSLFNKEPWYVTYKYNWNAIEIQLKELHEKTYSVLLNDIVSYVKSFDQDHQYDSIEGIIPSATLLTGVNQPDHANQFLALIHKIREDVTPHVAMISSQDASTVKHLVESAVSQLIHGQDYLDDSADDSMTEQTIRLKKSQCTMRALHNWYQSKYVSTSPKKLKHAAPKKTLVVIMPDFESFSCNILQDFVMIVSSYITSLPIVLIFGVATSVSALHKSFPYHVSSKLLIKVFHSHPSHVYMNQVLENIFLTHTSPFHLCGRAFELLTDVFLFYDFSVTGLVQSIKYCMMEHYYGDNIKALCCSPDKIEETISKLTSVDLEHIRQLLSFRPFLEIQECETKIGLFEDDNFFREVLCKEMHKLHDYLYSFYLCVRLLSALVKDLPKNLLGKTVREIYAKCSIEHVTNTQPFKECMQLLNFQSQVKMADSIKNALKEINSVLQIVSPVKPLRSTPSKTNMNSIAVNNDLGQDFAKSISIHFLTFLRQIENAHNEAPVLAYANHERENDLETDIIPGNRYKLKEKLLKATRVEKIQSEFEMVRSRFVSYLEEMFAKGLRPPRTQTFHEILFFSDLSSVKKQIVGSPRGALHLALNNPVHYLQCSCCHLPSPESISEWLPDVSIAYKLHRECGKHINLYDWLQAFAAVLRPDEEDDERYQDAGIQVRFTRAVAELQFLGFIKSSKRKTDHVMRLTW